MFIRVVYNKFDENKIQDIINKIKSIESKFCFLDIDSCKKEDTNLIFSNDIKELNSLIEKKQYKNIVIITECINSNFILECLNYTSSICYLNANINIIIGKIKSNIRCNR